MGINVRYYRKSAGNSGRDRRAPTVFDPRSGACGRFPLIPSTRACHLAGMIQGQVLPVRTAHARQSMANEGANSMMSNLQVFTGVDSEAIRDAPEMSDFHQLPTQDGSWVRGQEAAQMPQKRNIKRRSTRSTLRLPDLDLSKNSVLQSLGSATSKRTYGAAIEDFISWYCSEPRLAFGRTVVLRYRYELESRRLAPATINLRLAAVRRLAYEASDMAS